MTHSDSEGFMKKGGTGGSHTQTGAAFEKQTDLVRKLTDAGYDISGFAILSKGIEVGRIARQTHFSKQILRPFGVEWKDYISKELQPDKVDYHCGEKISAERGIC
jgi:hypothetical protein